MTRREQIANLARHDAIRQYVKRPTASNLPPAQARALSLATALPYRVALWSATGQRLLEVGSDTAPSGAAPPVMFPDGPAPGGGVTNDLFAAPNGVIFSQTVAAITDPPVAPGGTIAGQLLGYLVVRAVVANPGSAGAGNSADLVTELLGARATMALGTRTGGVWTNLTRQVPPPPVDLSRAQVTQFEGVDGARHIGALVSVSGTPLAVWVEFPIEALLAPAGSLLRQGAWLGFGCLLLGSVLVAAAIARSTWPLTELARAAEHLAAGDYARRVTTRGSNDIGQLAASFNVMAARVEEAYRAVRHTQERTEFALAAFRIGVWELDLASSQLQWAASMAAVYGLPTNTAPTSFDTVLACIHPDDRARVADAVASRQDYALEFRVVWPDETIHWVNSRAHIQWDEEERVPARLLGVSLDITDRKVLEDALFAEQERAAVTLHSIGDAVVSTNIEGRVTYVNAAAERLTGWPSADGLGRPLLDVLHIVDATTRVVAADPTAIATPQGKQVDLFSDCLLIRRNGSDAPVEGSAAPIHDRHGRVVGAVNVLRDVSTERALALKMTHLARYDVLTGLPNRTLFEERITHAIITARRKGTRLAVLFVDLDRFKHINDSLGHAIGDALIRSVGARLVACVRATDTVCRRGGDEFVVLLTDLEKAEPAANVAEKIIASLWEPHDVLEHVLHVTASIGISVYPDDALDPNALISAADTAMYHAKESGRANSQFFTAEMNVRSVARRGMEGNMRQALRRKEFLLHYQPKVNLATSAIVGVEALLRWRHPNRGLVAPAEFVGLAEECGLILPIGRWVLREACGQAKAWQDEGLPSGAISVNVSALEFRAKGFLAYVTEVLEDTGLDPQHLELELTESVLMAHVETTTRVLHELKELGVRLAIDDFGTGYCGLSYLSRFPIDTLKIDRSFVQGLAMEGHDATIINAIIGMGRSLNHCVVAEGVENAEQLALLQRYKCGQGQGYYFSRPIPPPELADLLRDEPAASDPTSACATGS